MEVIFGAGSSGVKAKELQKALKDMDLDGTLYLGYPVLSTADERIFVDALLISQSCGLVAFDLSTRSEDFGTIDELRLLEERQGQIHASLYNKLNAKRELRRGRSLAVDINVVTCHPRLSAILREQDVIACPPGKVPEVIREFETIQEDLIRPLFAAIQRVSTLRPAKRRENVRQPNSKGAIIKRIEKEIANLDEWQNRAAIEYAEGPQRIRGLAGSGKTVVLALKAAYLHTRYPEWTVAVTFQTRSLYQQFKDLIRRFTFDQIDDEPNWSNMRILHAWGSAASAGIYSTACDLYERPPLDWRTAQRRFGRTAFKGRV